MDSIVSLDELQQQKHVLEHYVAQFDVIANTALQHQLKALDLGNGSKGFNRAISGLRSYINAANLAVEHGLTN